MKKCIPFVVLAMLLVWSSCSRRPMLPGPFRDGTLLPNRWMLTPAGRHIPVGDLPLNMVVSPDGSLLAVTNNGFSRQFISMIDIKGDSVIT